MVLSDEQYLEKLYYDPKKPASFSSPIKFYEAIKEEGKRNISLATIKKWLSGQDTYTLHRSRRKPFKRRHIIVDGIKSQYDADLIDFQSYVKDNDGIRYVLLTIDVFTRFVYLEPLKTKKCEDVREGLKAIFKHGKCEFLRTDSGKEFTGHIVQTYLKEMNIVHFIARSELKANFAERAIKTIKSKIIKYFTKTLSHRYIDVLKDIQYSYNHTKHRSIGMSPSEVNSKNSTALWRKLYLPYLSQNEMKKSRYKFKIGQKVKIPYSKTTFDREYSLKWSGEIFEVIYRTMKEGIPIYRLKDFNGEPIKGIFYNSELQKVTYDPDKPFLVHKVLAKKGNRVKVSWLGWPRMYDSWINK